MIVKAREELFPLDTAATQMSHTDLLLIFLSVSIKLLGEVFGHVLPEGLGADQVLLNLLHLEAWEDEKVKYIYMTD